jgi:leucyl aminopeptidase
MPAPGADDDGSGTVTILEAFRVLTEHIRETGEVFEQTVEFHWYSAEEGGLLGSQAIFSQYENEGRDVVAMLQQVCFYPENIYTLEWRVNTACRT